MRDTARAVVYAKALSFDTSGNSTTTLNTVSPGGAVYRLYSTVDCGVNFGTTATSDGTNFVLMGGLPEYIEGAGLNIAAKGISANGTLYIACMGSN